MTVTLDYFRDRDDLLFAFRGKVQLWVWREDHWSFEPSGSYLQVHLHQAAYRGDGRARALDALPEGVPEPPERPPPALKPGVTAPELAKQLGQGRRRVYLVLTRDSYEETFGDGRIDSLESVALDRTAADSLAKPHGQMGRVRSVEIVVDEEELQVHDQERGAFETWDLEQLAARLSSHIRASDAD